MANYSELKAAIRQVVRANDNQEITGSNLQEVLLSMVSSLGDNFQFAGIAIPSTNPGTPDQNVFYIAGPGSYVNFGNYTVPGGSIGIFTYDGSWDKQSIDIAESSRAAVGYFVCDTAAATAAKTIAATGYALATGGNIRIKMTNANTADAVTLNINNTGEKALFYNGKQASSTNSWEPGEVLEVYYDGTRFNTVIDSPQFSMVNGQDLTKYMADNKYIGLSSYSVGDIVSTNYSSLNGYGCIRVPYYKNKTIILTGKGGASPRLWAFLDKSFRLIEVSSSNATVTNRKLSSSEDGYFIANINKAIPYQVQVFDIDAKEYTEVKDNSDYIFQQKYFDDVLKDSENFIDIDAQTDDVIIQNSVIRESGSIGSNSNYYISDYIRVVADRDYMAANVGNPNFNTLGAFYDVDKKLISTIIYTAPITPNEVKFTTPSNCVYVRLNMFKSTTQKMLIKYGSSTDKYRSYGYIPKSLRDIFSKPLANLYPFKDKIGSFMGDSITYGYNPDGGSRIQENWVKIVGEKLLLSITHNYGIVSSTIAAKEGDEETKDPMVNRVSSIDVNSDLIVIAGGTNDWKHHWTPFGDVDVDKGNAATKYTFCGALDILCRELIARFPSKQVAFLTPIKRERSGLNSLGKTLADYVNAIKMVCLRYSIPVFDMYANVCINPYYEGITEESPQYELLIPDGTHPNAAGHSVMAKGIFGFLNSL